MKKNSPILSGAIYLTAAGLIAKVIGFFYRMFLSQTFGAESVGIYQLISPALVLAYSLCAAGIQSSISKLISAKASNETLWIGMFLSVLLSLFCTIFVYTDADWIARSLLLEPRLEPLLKITSFSYPLSSIHACINGYFYGKKKALSPALSQLIEQALRGGSVFLLCSAASAKGVMPSLSLSATGVVIGEIRSVLFSFFMLFGDLDFAMPTHFRKISGSILAFAIPLSASRLIVNFLQSIENIYIPNRLLLYGFNSKTSLSIFGVLTGMALPLVLFPTAITGSVALMLLPVVSEAQASKDWQEIRTVILRTVLICMLLGFLFSIFFLLFGPLLGRILFKNELAGNFIITLSFICPFLYVNGSLSSIINGLGKTIFTLLSNLASLIIRLLFVFIAIPRYGITGYLWGLLLSQISITFCSVIFLQHLTGAFSIHKENARSIS